MRLRISTQPVTITGRQSLASERWIFSNKQNRILPPSKGGNGSRLSKAMFMFSMTANCRILDKPAATNRPPTATMPTTPDNRPGEVNNAGKADRNWDVMFTN